MKIAKRTMSMYAKEIEVYMIHVEDGVQLTLDKERVEEVDGVG